MLHKSNVSTVDLWTCRFSDVCNIQTDPKPKPASNYCGTRSTCNRTRIILSLLLWLLIPIDVSRIPPNDPDTHGSSTFLFPEAYSRCKGRKQSCLVREPEPWQRRGPTDTSWTVCANRAGGRSLLWRRFPSRITCSSIHTSR